MVEKVIETLKGTLGIPTEIQDFDFDLVMYVNLAVETLNQIGVELPEVDMSTDWNMLNGKENKSMIKNYICLKVKMLFDPPSNSSTVKAIEEQIRESEFRLQIKKGE